LLNAATYSSNLDSISSNNYQLSSIGAAGVLTVTPKLLTVSALVNTGHSYGAAAATPTYTLSSTANGDVLAPIFTVTNAAGKAVVDGTTLGVGTYTITATSLSATAPALAANYALATNTSSLFAITPATLTLSGLAVATKTYDATTAASYTLTGTVGTQSGATSQTLTTAQFASNITGSVFNADVVSVVVNSVVFNNANVACSATCDGTNGIAQTALVSAGLTGANAANYVLAIPTKSAIISPATLTLTAAVQTKTYDGTTVSNGAVVVTGLKGADAITALTQSYSSADVAMLNGSVTTRSIVVNNGYVLSDGNAGGNYAVVKVAANGTINQAPLRVVADSSSKTYGVLKTFTGSEFTATGFVAGQSFASVTLTSTGAAASATVAGGPYAIVASAAVGAGSTTVTNYAISYLSGSLVVNPASLTLTGLTDLNGSGAATHVYGAAANTISATWNNGSALPNADAATVANLGATFRVSSAANKTVVDGTTLGVGTYTVSLAGITNSNYVLSGTQATTSFTVTPKTLTLSSATIASKVYDGTTTATYSVAPTITAGLINSDAVSLMVGAPVYAASDAAAGIGITQSLGLSGVSAANYTFVTPTITGTITAKSVTITSLLTTNHTWGTSATAPVASLSGVVAGQTLAPTYVVKTTGGVVVTDSATLNAATYNVTVGSLNNTNYTLVNPSFTNTLVISPAVITVTSITVADHAYGSSATAPNAVVVFGNVPAGVTISLGGANGTTTSGYTTATFATSGTSSVTDSNTLVKGSYFVTVTGFNNPNLVLTSGTKAVGAFQVTGLQLMYTATPTTLVYGNSPGVMSGTISTAGLMNGDTLASVLSGSPVWGTTATATSNVGSYGITITNLSSVLSASSNYSLIASPANTTALTITPAPLNVTGITVAGKVYDSTTTVANTSITAANVSFSGVKNGDVLALNQSSLTAAYASANVGAAVPVSVQGLTVTGAKASNYSITFAGLTAAITPAPLTLSGLTGTNKVYDTTTSDTLSGTATLAGVLTADVGAVALSGSGTANFATANVGTGLGLTVTGYSLSGAAAANYSLTLPAGLMANITAKSISVSGLSAANLVYSGSSSTTLSGTPVLTSGAANASDGKFYSTDTVNLVTGSPFGIFADANVAIGKAVTISGYSLSNSNYVLTTTGVLTATISAKPLTLTGTVVADKTYDGTNAATITSLGSLSGVVGTDVVAVAGGSSASFTLGANVACSAACTGSNVSAQGVTLAMGLTGAAATNYSLTLPSVTAKINPLTISATGVVIADKTYDGTTAATFSSVGTLSGVLTADANYVAIANTGNSASFVSPNVSYNGSVVIAQAVSASLKTASGTSGDRSGNYVIAAPSGLLAAITPLGITVSGATVANKTYDGTVAATISSLGTLSGVLSADVSAVSLAAGAGFASFNSANVNRSGGTVIAQNATVTGITLSGLKAGNYRVANAAATGTITPASLTITADSVANFVGLSDPTFTATYRGFVNGETATALTTGPGFSRAAGSSAGNYSVTPSATANNYSITAVAGTLTIIGYETLVVSATNASSVYGSSIGALGATAAYAKNNGTTGAPLTVVYTLSQTGSTVSAGSTLLSFSDATAGLANTTTISVAISTAATSASAVGTYSLLAGTPTVTSATSNFSTIAPSINGVLTITPKALTVTGTTVASKAYDGLTTASITAAGTLVGVVNNDVVSLVSANTPANSGVAIFVDANRNSAQGVTVTGMALTGAGATNYTLTQPTGVTAAIATKLLTVSGTTVANKVYDGGVTATITSSGTLVGLLGSDVVTIVNSGTPATSGTAVFTDANVGANRSVTISGFTLTGAAAANYGLLQPSTVTASITPLALTVTGATVAAKVYDGSTAATITADGTLVGILGSDAVSILNSNTPSLSGTAIFASANVNATQGVTISGLSLTGAAAGNYSLVQPTGVTAAITPKALTLSGTSIANKVYDITTTATITNAGALSGMIAGDVVTLNSGSATASFASADVAYQAGVVTSKAVTVSGLALSGAAAANYSVAQPVGLTATITPKLLSLSGVVATATKVYDATLGATVTSSGALTAGAANATDGRYYAGDAIGLSGNVIASYNSVNVATANSIGFDLSGLTLTGAAAKVGDYILSPVASVAGSITPKTLSMSGLPTTTLTKVYDGTTAVSLSGTPTLAAAEAVGAGSVGDGKAYVADSVAIVGSAVGTYNSANVATASTVTFSGLGLTGGQASNYILSMQAPTAGAITPAPLSVINLSVASKTYDGTTAAIANTSSLMLLGAVSVDASNSTKLALDTSAVSAAFASANVAYSGAAVISQAVSLSGLVLTGTSAANYVLTQPSATGTINPLSISITAAAANKPYDSFLNATATVSTTSAVALADLASGSARLSLGAGTATFASSNAANGLLVTVSGITLSGTAAKNYLFNTTANSSADITKAALTITAENDSKVYGEFSTLGGVAYVANGNNTTSQSLVTTGYRVTGLISTDTITGVTLSSTGGLTRAAVNAVNGGAYAIAPSAATGTGFENYNISYVNGALTVTPAALLITATGTDKIYNASPSDTATLTVSGLKNGDSLTTAYSAATFANANVGTATEVVVSGITISNKTLNGITYLSANYTANTTAITSANITTAALTISATGVDKVYNGNVSDTVTLSVLGVQGSDSLTLGYGTAVFADSNVSYGAGVPIAKAVSVAGISVSGAAAGNYTFNTVASTTAVIRPATLVVTAAATNKAYDRNTLAAVTLANNAISGDAVTLAYVGASFSDANAANGKTVTVSGLSLSGAAAGNYTLNGVTAVTALADINKIGLTITAADDTKVYGATTTAGALTYTTSGASAAVTTSASSRFTVAGLLTGDSVAGVTLTSQGGVVGATVSGGPYAIIANAVTGTGVANYTVTYINGALVVTPAVVSVTAVAADKTYNGTPAATATLTPTGILAADANSVTLAYVAANFASQNVAYSGAPAVVTTQAVNVTGINLTGTAASNYVLASTSAATTATILPATLLVTASAANKIYDARDIATVTLSNNSLAGDAVTVNYATSKFASANVAYTAGANPVVTSQVVTVAGLSLAGAQRGNYTLGAVSSVQTTATVTPASLTITATGNNKTYDGTTAATVSLAVVGVQGTDSVTASYTSAIFADANVGSSIPVSINGLSVTGASGTNSGNYVTNVSTTASANIAAAPLTVTASAATMTYGDSGLAYTYTTAGWVNTTEQTNAATLLTGVTVAASATNAGVYADNIIATGGAARNYVMTYVAGTLTINKAALTATLQNTAKVIGDVDPAFVFAYTGFKNGDTAAVSNITAPAVTIAGGSPVSAGAYAITASGGSATNYVLSRSYTGSTSSVFTVIPAQQLLITLDANDTVVYGVATPTITVASAKYSTNNGSGGYNVYALSNLTNTTGNTWTGVDAINGGQISTFGVNTARTQYSAVGAYSTGLVSSAGYYGNYIVSVKNSNNVAVTPNYLSATFAAGVLTVTPAALTITATNDGKVYGTTTTSTNAVSYVGTSATGGASSFTSTGLLGTDSISSVALSSAGAVAAATIGAGPYAINISNAQGAGLSNYSITYTSGSMTVGRAILTIAATADSKVYGTTTTTNALTYTGSTVSSATGFTTAGLVNGDTIYNLTLTSSGALTTAVVGGGSGAAGKYLITPSSAVGSPTIASNYSIVYVDGLLNVTPATLTVSAANDTKVYGATTTQAGLVYAAGIVQSSTGYSVSGLVNGDAVTGVTLASNGALATASVAGSAYAITPSLATGTGLTNNYNITYQNGLLSVTPKALTVVASNAGMNYGASALPSLAYSATGLVNGDNISGTLATSATAYSGVAGSGSNVGSYNIAQGTLTAGGNYNLSFTQATLSVLPVALSVAANAQTSIYGVAKNLGTTQVTTTGLVNGDAISGVVLTQNGSATIAATQNAGAYANAISVGAISGITLGNYILSTATGTLTVQPAALTITASNVAMSYGASSLPNLTYTAPGLVNGDTLSGALSTAATAYVTGAAGSASNVGTYAIAQGSLSASANYTVTFVAGTLTVNPVALTITASSQSVVYGAGATLSGTAFTSSGLVNGDTVSTVLAKYNNSATVNVLTNAGVYTNSIVLSSATGVGLSNYTLQYSTGNLTVTPATLTVVANNQTMVYGASSLPVLSYTTNGLVNGDTTTGALATTATRFNGTAGSASSVGNYAITQGTLAAGSNYTLGYTAGNLTVTSATLVVTASTQSTVYGTAIANLGSTAFTTTGLVNGDVVTAATLRYAGSDSVAATVNAGTYAASIVASAAVGTNLSNYSLSYTGGNLVVTQAPVSIVAAAQSVTYSANALPALTYSATGLKNGDLLSGALTTIAMPYSGAAGSASNVGSYAITQGTLTAGANYLIAYTATNLTVNPATLTVTATAQATTYGTTYTLGTTSFSSVGLLNGDSITSVNLTYAGNTVVPGTTASNAYAISANSAAGVRLSNYTLTYQSGVLTVNPKPLNVIANSATMVYADATLPTFTYQNVTGLVNGDVVTGSLTTLATAFNGSAGSASNVGVYGILQGSVTAGSNYAITYTPASLTVTSANLAVSAADQSTIYGSLLVLPQNGLTTTGLKNGDYVASATILYNGNQVVPGTVNVGSYAAALAINSASGVGLSNYVVSYTAGTLAVNKALLTVTAVADAKFVSQTDLQGSATNCGLTTCTGGYAGAMVSGFQNSDSVAGGALGLAPLVIARTNFGTNTVGVFSGVLMPAGLNPQNYNVQYVAGDYVIAPAQQLLVKMDNNTTAYGTAPTYGSVTAAYLKNDGTIISNIPVTVVGSTVSLNDLLGSTAQFTAGATIPVLSSSGQLSIGNYSLGASAFTKTGTNFNSMVVVGGLNVTPKQLTYADLNISGVSKVYDGSVTMNNLTINTPTGFVVGDQIIATATGTFATKNVGTSINYNLGVLLGGVDRANYQIVANSQVNSGLYAGANGVITQLNSVTYTGPNSGGNWSNPANWTTTGTTAIGAVPDLSNVANVVIPVGLSVVYDNAVAGPVTSAILNNGNLNINLAANTPMSMPIAGGGSVALSGAGVITMAGANAYSGGTILNPGSSIVVANASAIGTPNVTSNASALNPASFKVSAGVTLPFLNITGGTVQLMSDITTVGTQSYSNLILAATGSGTTTLASNNANIVFRGLIDSANAKAQSLAVSAGTGSVVLGDSIGSVARLSRVTVTAGVIDILADILTANSQTYNGPVFIGDAAYLGKTPTVGFLFNSRANYFEYSAAGVTSTISYLNRNPLFVRTLISEDPSVTFNGSVNDLVTATHTLLIGAIATDNSTAASNAASVTFAAPVGALSPLYSVNVQTVVNAARPDLAASYVGSIAVTGGVETFASQIYRASVMTAQAATQPGNVVFSVYDPTATVSYYLPPQSNGQMNLQNPNSTDTLTINAVNNYAALPNSTGTNNWGTRLIQGNAFNYVPPAYVAPGAPSAQAPSQPVIIRGGSPVLTARPVPPPVAPQLPSLPIFNPTVTGTELLQFMQSYTNTPVVESAPRAESSAPPPALVANVTVEQTAVVSNVQDVIAPSPASTGSPSVPVNASEAPVAQTWSLLGSTPAAAPVQGFVNIQVEGLVNGAAITLVSSSPVTGFAFTVPESVLAGLTSSPFVNTPATTGGNFATNTNVVTGMSAGTAPVGLSPGAVTSTTTTAGTTTSTTSTRTTGAQTEGAIRITNSPTQNSGATVGESGSTGTGTVSVSAVMSDGSPLPSWLSFDPATKTFSAQRVPEGAQPLKIKLQTLDGSTVVGETVITINTK